jgi:hypothetical protein
VEEAKMLSGRRVLALLALGAMAAVALAGCGDAITMSDVSDTNDEEILARFTEDHGFFDDSAVYEQPAEENDGREAIDPVRVWREITDRVVTREIHIDQEEGTADLAVTKEIWGNLNILAADGELYVKDMHHTGERFATFERTDAWTPPYGDSQGQGTSNGDQAGVGNGADEANGSGDTVTSRYRRGPWVLTAVSGVVMRSEVLTMQIDSIRFEGPGVDVTITDPSMLLDVPDEIMSFEVGDPVTVTVSGPAADALVSLHSRARRWPLQYENGVFTGTWTVSRRGAHVVAVQALARDSIYDSEYPDDCLIWAVPYAVGYEDQE